MKNDTFEFLNAKKNEICGWRKKGAFRAALKQSEWLDIIGEACLGSYERIVQVRALFLFTDFKRANFEFWKSRIIREILAKKVYFWAFKRAKSVKLDLRAFQAS